MQSRWSVFLAALAVSTASHAITLEEALDMSQTRATALQGLAAETRRASAVYQQSAQAYLPSISADASWLRADSSVISQVPVPVPGPPPGIQRRDLGPAEGTVRGVQVVQPLLNMDAIRKRQAAQLQLEASRYAEHWGRQALRLEVSRRYFTILSQRAREVAANMTHRAAAEAARLAHSSYRKGLASRLDTERADAELAATRARIRQAEAALQQAKLEFSSLLGMPSDQPLELTTALPEPAPPARLSDSLERKDLQAREEAARAAGLNTQAARAQWLPRLNLLARKQWVNGNEPLDASAEGWLVAVNLTWTLFDGMGRQGRIAESRAEEDIARIELEEARRRIQQEQGIALSRWRASWAGWHAAGEALHAAERAAHLASRRYVEGLGSMSDLLDTQARLDRQRVELINARYQAVLSAMNYYLQHGYDPLLALGRTRS